MGQAIIIFTAVIVLIIIAIFLILRPKKKIDLKDFEHLNLDHNGLSYHEQDIISSTEKL